MRHSWHSRLLGILLAPWFLMVALEVAPATECPMHRAAPVVQSVDAIHAAHNTTAADVAANHAQHASHASQQSGDKNGSSNDHTSHICTCITCCCATPATTSPVAPTVAVSTIAARPPRAIVHRVQVAVTRVEHTLPFANGPPAVRQSA